MKNVRPATKEEVAAIRKQIKSIIKIKERFSCKMINGETTDIKRYEPFTPEEGLAIVDILEAAGFVNIFDSNYFDTFRAKPHHTTFGNTMVKI